MKRKKGEKERRDGEGLASLAERIFFFALFSPLRECGACSQASLLLPCQVSLRHNVTTVNSCTFLMGLRGRAGSFDGGSK